MTDVEALIELIRERDHVSFTELERVLDERSVPTKGNQAIFIGTENVILWAGMSPEFVEAVLGLRGRAEPEPCDMLVYLIDGRLLSLPLAKRIPKHGYKEPHWVPAVFRLVSA